MVGRFVDRVGTRIGYAVALVALVAGGGGTRTGAHAAGLRLARFFLGLGEAGNFPSAIKTTAEWFPRRERALADGDLQCRLEHRRRARAR